MTPKTKLTKQEQDEWDSAQQKRGAPFSQSSWWGAFREELGDRVFYFSEDRWAALVIEVSRSFGKYWKVPYGPTADSVAAMRGACDALSKAAKDAHALLLRVEPQQVELFDPSGFKRALVKITPANTIINDLTRSEDEIMAGMRQTNRSDVRQAIRKGVTFKHSYNPEDINLFYKMQQGVSKRTGAVFYSLNYYKTQANLLMPSKHMSVEIAYGPDGKPLATAVCHDYAGKTTYTYAAATEEANKFHATRFLVYSSMIAAKKRGQKRYDLYGIAAPDAKGGDSWLGFTHFKKQFGGNEVAFAGTWDKPIQRSKYAAFRIRDKALATRNKYRKQRRKK